MGASAPAHDAHAHRRDALGLAMALGGAVAFSGKAIIVKLAYRHGVDAITLIMLRMAFALPLFAALAWWAGRGQAALGRREWLAVLGLGFSGYYLASLLDFMGLAYISASLERLILYLNPTFVLLLGVLWQRQRLHTRQLVAAGLGYAGLWIALSHEGLGAQSPQWLLGVALVLASALSYAVYLLASGVWVQRLGVMRLTGLASGVACLLCLAHFALTRPLGSALGVPTPVLWLSLLNAVACTFVPVVLVMSAIARIGSARTAQVGMVGPLSTIGMGIALLDEPFTPWLALGTGLVLAGVGLLSRPLPAGSR